MTRAATRLRRPLATAALVVLLAGAVGACAGGSDPSSDGGSGSDSGASAAEVPPAAEAESSGDLADSDGGATSARDVAEVVQAAPEERKLISQGSVELRSEDVGQALFDVQQVVDAFAGEVAQNEVETDKAGEVLRARLVLRIPSARFADAVTRLEGAADLVASSTHIQDVTTKVIDNEVRLRVQRRSIRRIEVLLDEATSIRDIVSIEEQLSQRQAELGSLERQQAYLADQTTQSTITVSIERTKKAAEPAEKDDRAGFAAGLDSGWTGFKNVTVALATALGAALPFLLLLVVLALPARLLVRRAARRRTPPATAQP